jgi:hypothetical protein
MHFYSTPTFYKSIMKVFSVGSMLQNRCFSYLKTDLYLEKYTYRLAMHNFNTFLEKQMLFTIDSSWCKDISCNGNVSGLAICRLLNNSGLNFRCVLPNRDGFAFSDFTGSGIFFLFIYLLNIFYFREYSMQVKSVLLHFYPLIINNHCFQIGIGSSIRITC